MSDTLYYRWVLIDNQETCYTCVFKLLDGFFSDSEFVKEYYAEEYPFRECLFNVRCLEFSETHLSGLLKRLDSLFIKVLENERSQLAR
jgi:hypothetical protein